MLNPDKADKTASAASVLGVLREGTRYWVEMRHDRKSRWNAWIDTPERAYAVAEFERLSAAFPNQEWRLGQTTEKVEALDVR